MSKADVDKYLAALPAPKRGTLEALRSTILEIVPEAEECISYGVPAFRLDGKVVAGFAAFKNHLSYCLTAVLSFRSWAQRPRHTAPRLGRCNSRSIIRCQRSS